MGDRSPGGTARWRLCPPVPVPRASAAVATRPHAPYPRSNARMELDLSTNRTPKIPNRRPPLRGWNLCDPRFKSNELFSLEIVAEMRKHPLNDC
jgi:hypothetical protein